LPFFFSRRSVSRLSWIPGKGLRSFPSPASNSPICQTPPFYLPWNLPAQVEITSSQRSLPPPLRTHGPCFPPSRPRAGIALSHLIVRIMAPCSQLVASSALLFGGVPEFGLDSSLSFFRGFRVGVSGKPFFESFSVFNSRAPCFSLMARLGRLSHEGLTPPLLRSPQ